MDLLHSSPRDPQFLFRCLAGFLYEGVEDYDSLTGSETVKCTTRTFPTARP